MRMPNFKFDTEIHRGTKEIVRTSRSLEGKNMEQIKYQPKQYEFDESAYIDPLEKFGKKIIKSPDKSNIGLPEVSRFEDIKADKMVINFSEYKKSSVQANGTNKVCSVEIGNVNSSNPERYDKYFVDRSRVSEALPSLNYKDIRLKNTMKVSIPFSERGLLDKL